MNNQRIFLWALLALVVWFTYEAWMRDYGPKPVAQAPVVTGATPSSESSVQQPVSPQQGLSESVPGLPADPAVAQTAAAPVAAASAGLAAAAQTGGAEVRVVTDVLDVDIGLTGGTLQRADLLQYLKHKNQPGVLVRLLDDAAGKPVFLLQSGLTAGAAGAQPDHRATFTSLRQEYRLPEGQNELRVPLTWTDAQGRTVVK